MISVFTPSLYDLSLSYLSIFNPSLSMTLRLVSLVSLIAKTKRIAERSDTNCDTHTDRQSTLDKYMINIKIKENVVFIHNKERGKL
jgi:hypothetical protein